MSEQENGESNNTKKIVIVLVVISAILGIYYFNKPITISDNPQGQDEKEEEKYFSEMDTSKINDSNEKEEEKQEVSSVTTPSIEVKVEDMISSVGVKTASSQGGDVEQKNITKQDAVALVNSLIVSPPVAVVTMEPKKAAEKAVNYINQYIVPEGQNAKITNVFAEKVAFYKFLLSVGEQEYTSYVSVDGKKLVTGNEYNLDENPNKIDGKEFVKISNGYYEIKGAEICKENGKPIVYFFGSKSCPHCDWQSPIVNEVVKGFEGKISYHENIDNTKELDILSKYSPQGSIPTTIIGCKYFKVGSGENIGEEKEKQAITDLINKILQ